jgi:hypothetical protein
MPRRDVPRAGAAVDVDRRVPEREEDSALDRGPRSTGRGAGVAGDCGRPPPVGRLRRFFGLPIRA